MKKVFIALMLLVFGTLSAHAQNPITNLKGKVEASINSPQRQIKSTLKSHNRALRAQNLDAVKSFYDENYKSSDGFNLEELSKLLEKTYSAYGTIKYKTKINSIAAFDNYAIAQMSDCTKATVYPTEKKDKSKAGILDGKSVYVIYLKKSGSDWKIFYDDILMEETSLKYGIANKIDMKLKTPAFIQNGDEYDLSLSINKPDDLIALASITNEEIKFPTPELNEKYRKFPSFGNLERIVRANKNNIDEYAVASIGFTKVSVNEEVTKARIEVLGMAYLMKRINMQTPPNRIEEIKGAI